MLLHTLPTPEGCIYVVQCLSRPLVPWHNSMSQTCLLFLDVLVLLVCYKPTDHFFANVPDLLTVAWDMLCRWPITVPCYICPVSLTTLYFLDTSPVWLTYLLCLDTYAPSLTNWPWKCSPILKVSLCSLMACAVIYLQFYTYVSQDSLGLYKVSPTRKSLRPLHNFPL